jgi:hypothetical protein
MNAGRLLRFAKDSKNDHPHLPLAELRHACTASDVHVPAPLVDLAGRTEATDMDALPARPRDHEAAVAEIHRSRAGR